MKRSKFSINLDKAFADFDKKEKKTSKREQRIMRVITQLSADNCADTSLKDLEFLIDNADYICDMYLTGDVVQHYTNHLNALRNKPQECVRRRLL